MMVVPTYLAPSPIHGIGVFAAEPVPAGTRVWIPAYERSYTAEEMAEMPPVLREFMEMYGYEHAEHPGVTFCGIDNGRFMNHADDPNTVPGNQGYIACRDIAAGEEFTCDYALLGGWP